MGVKRKPLHPPFSPPLCAGSRQAAGMPLPSGVRSGGIGIVILLGQVKRAAQGPRAGRSDASLRALSNSAVRASPAPSQDLRCCLSKNGAGVSVGNRRPRGRLGGAG